MTTTPPVMHDLEGMLGRLRSAVARGAECLEDVVGLPTTQLAALQAISDGTTTVSDVARQCLTHVSSASRTIDALVQEGLVDRSTDPDDRRAVILSLTPAGRTRSAAIDDHRRRLLDRAMAGFDEGERHQLVHLLDRFLTSFEEGLTETFPTR